MKGARHLFHLAWTLLEADCLAGASDEARRAVFLGESKLDFLVDDVYLELKAK